MLRPGEMVTIELEREQVVRAIQVTLGTDVEKDRFGQTYRRGLLGVSPVGIVFEPVPPLKLVPAATSYVWQMTRTMLEALIAHITKEKTGFGLLSNDHNAVLNELQESLEVAREAKEQSGKFNFSVVT